MFAQLLRSLLQDHYDIRTNVPVGDLPREADIVLLKRKADAPQPFAGIWQHLTRWNVLEFKGPTDDPAFRDLDLLVELGLGIDRWLNAEQTRQKLGFLDRTEVSWWYLANHLGNRFTSEAERVFGGAGVVG